MEDAIAKKFRPPEFVTLNVVKNFALRKVISWENVMKIKSVSAFNKFKGLAIIGTAINTVLLLGQTKDLATVIFASVPEQQVFL